MRISTALGSAILGSTILLAPCVLHAQESPQEVLDQVQDETSREDSDSGVKPPFTVASWNSMTQKGQMSYIRITIEGLRWSPRYAACRALTPERLIDAVRLDATGGEPDGPLLMHVASAAVRLCT
ncbi:hypothetical protein [uncultured Salinicola sp.]|uniref:hypothetical protein n=1 Tax=uncultured Salinicola sp. TaxID=1193542 RepID=UPI0026135577|nr:hypothetical protein [uncultured Salinicola sp.]|tara:strand:- start:1580 stop:1954 length:375 start_codon:yes stop_codon:yes gene_type:complete